ncbi:protein translocase subunit SecF [Methylomarinum sp. Ch1-1]|uniref:Protein-export membrane protein SecF n=1 Tax=Methylomarinum roseum TaxID=3067653 RepID=A0AAU7NUA2_9GAMM|nr:protein translocase subunit SecF [Methylomarinum sp. Ch1-1]MDP4519316.1 protein translocase subunit SecF [Methylomarinum sp. Ch1-1]
MFKQEIDFLGKRKLALIFSSLLLVMSIVSLALNGLKLGIDFTGGTLVEVGYDQAADLSALRASLDEAGFADATVQNFGTAKDVLIRIKPDENLSSSELSTQVLEAINKNVADPAELRRVEFVGPQVGDDLAEDGGLALLYSVFGILIYVAWRFEYKFSLGSVAALVHDVIITLGVFSAFAMEFDLTVLAAILAVIGYSLNDTIVVYDRIRENFRKLRKGDSEQIMNASLNQTLNRTLMTSLTTALVLLALAFLGGEIIHNFALALLIGVVIGTYSSIYVASPVVLALGISKDDLMIPEKEGVDIDEMP